MAVSIEANRGNPIFYKYTKQLSVKIKKEKRKKIKMMMMCDV